MKNTSQVHVDDRVPFVERHLADRSVAKDPGVVDQDIEPAPFVADAIHHRLDGPGVADISNPDNGTATAQGIAFINNPLRFLGDLAAGRVRMVKHHACPSFVKRRCYCRSDSLRSAGH